MKNWIKKTISVPLGKEDYIIALMDKIGFKEEDRKAIGGQMSGERLQITFGGYDVDYNENGYVKVEVVNNPDYGYFYSLRVPDGYYTDKLENFKDYHDKVKPFNFEVLSFDDGLSIGSISSVDEEELWQVMESYWRDIISDKPFIERVKFREEMRSKFSIKRKENHD